MTDNSGGTSSGIGAEAIAGWRYTPRAFAFPISVESRAAAPWIRAALLLGCAFAVQFAVGAYRASLGSYSDEPAHFLNALVLRDYLTTAIGTDPVAFARDFYFHYPKIAPLVWPPLFHVSLAILLLPGWAPYPAALAFEALIATAFRLSTFIRTFDSSYSGRLLPFAFLTVPLIIDGQSVVMVDLAVAMTALEAAWWLFRYLSDPRLKFAVMFGLWSAACCLCKGNGVSVVLLAPLMVILTGRYWLLKTAALRVAAAIVAGLAGPFLYISYRICAAMGDFTGTHLMNLEHRIRFFATFLWSQLTPVPMALTLVASAVLIHRARRPGASAPTIAATTLLALAVAGVAFHALLPLAFVHGPYVTIAIAPFIGLIPFGADAIAGWTVPRCHRAAKEALVLLAVAALLVAGQATQSRRSFGFQEAVDRLPTSLAGTRFLVVSDPQGEGAFIGEIAKRRPEPRATVIRSSKLLVEENWMGANSRLLFTSPAEILKQLQDLHVQYVVLDRSAGAKALPYWSHVQDLVSLTGDEFIIVSNVESSPRVRRSITTFRLAHPTDGPAKPFRPNISGWGGN